MTSPRLTAAVALPAAALVLYLPSQARPTPPGRNGLIAFVTHARSAEIGTGIAVVGPNGLGRRRLTRDRRDRSPAWSPDGRRLAFERGGRIYVINGDGTGLRRLTQLPTDARQPAWAPDGRQIAFTRETRAVVMLARADGTRARVIFRSGFDDTVDRPSWSPDGRWIAFGLLESAGGSIAVVRRDGRAFRYVTDGRVEPDVGAAPGDWADDHGPDWSPDGGRIVFTRVVWLCPRCDQEEIFSVKRDGSDVRWVTSDTADPGAGPAWSPDGSRIAAETSRGLTLFNAAGAPLRVLDPLGTEPAWQPLPRHR